MLENVQRRCTQQLPYLKDLSYEERLLALKIPTLAFLKMWSDIAQRQPGRGHDSKIYLQRASKSVRQKAFGLRIVSVWNNLPEEVVNATSINMFKNKLDWHWKNQDI